MALNILVDILFIITQDGKTPLDLGNKNAARILTDGSKLNYK